MGTYLAIWGAIALHGPHHVANASRKTTGFLAIVSLNWSVLWDTGVLVGVRVPVETVATHVARMWTVILGEVVVNCLDGIGKAEKGEARRVLKAGRRSLDDIGKERGLRGGFKLRL